MRDFLRLAPPEKVISLVGTFRPRPRRVTIPLDRAAGRVIAVDITASEPVPPFRRSLVDGFAVVAANTFGAKESNPTLLSWTGEIPIGQEAALGLDRGQAVYVNTGSMIPDGSDAVVMQEYARKNKNQVEITRPVHEGENIISIGEDIERGRKVLSAGKRLTPADMGILAALGISDITVYDRPNVGLISSGDELVDITDRPVHGQVRDINRYTVSAIIGGEGCTVTFLGIVRDDPDQTAAVLRSAMAGNFDLLLVSGGSSKGDRDFIVDTIEALGGKVLLHGISIKPGKPTILASLEGRPIFGLPGHPLSCIMVTFRFVLPLVKRLAGLTDLSTPTTRATLTASTPSSLGIEEYVGVSLDKRSDGLLATPIFTKSAAISPLSMAKGFIVIPAASEGWEAGEDVEVHLIG